MTRETLEVDVLIVGGGPAGLSAAIRLSQLVKARGGEPLSIAVLEKAREAGAHLLSGAVLDLSALKDLLPDYEALGAPLLAPVGRERVYFLTEHRALRAPVIPPPLANHGNALISLNQFGRWLAAQAEAGGIDLFTGFAGQEVLLDGSRVIGVRTGDRGRGKHGESKPTFEAGVDIHAKVTIFCDGVRGNLTKQLHRRLAIGAGREPEQYAIGIKELWEVPAGRIETGTVMHTLGHPLRHEEFGGGFIYALPDRMVSLGLVIGLDYHDPVFDPHVAFNRFKRHPLLTRLLDGGRLVRYGAKALPEGGWNTVPRTHLDGALIAGDAAGFVNSVRLKGIHLAMRTGMLAAETAFEAIAAGDTSAAALAAYQTRVDASAVRRELEPVRSVHQAFGHGLVPGLLYAGAAMVTRGRWLPDLQQAPGHRRMRTLRWYYGIEMASPAASRAVPPDRLLTFDKLTNVHFSGTAHDEDQPVHLLVHTEVCSSICGPEYGHPCTRFCPANVYEIIRETGAAPRLQINASNCVHCKTCDIMDPYGVITWVPPEGGGGPQYTGM
ncbi:MAG TPA: electron transfer flavoprotein-ubiquinone oxidoreductase [Vicinamibacterales bacterium]|nr:electron transfer flavoprotein-ubiquinone oxidoreductase [Vicinamibacterales bacterium]